MFQSKKSHRLMALALSAVVGLTATFAAAETVTPTGNTYGFAGTNARYYTDYMTLEEEQQIAKDLAIEVASEGFVLLKNENNVLPLAKGGKVSLFGMHSVSLIASTSGSAGGSTGANGIAESTLQMAMENAGYRVNAKLVDLYTKHKTLGTTSNELPMNYYSAATISSYNGYGDAAIIVFSRTGSEGGDKLVSNVTDHSNPADHELMLDDNEKALVKHVKEHYPNKPIIVLINSSNILQIPELAEPKATSEYGVDAIFWVGNTGNNAIEAIGKLISGEVNPSGHTVEVWERDFTKGPSFTNFGNQTQNVDENGDTMDAFFYHNGEATKYATIEYREGIYVGYKYYETAADDMNAENPGSGDEWYDSQVLYPYGYGLSYTTFDWELMPAADTAITDPFQKLSMQVKVTNTGDVAGKEVVQVYANPPYTKGGIEKASANLVGFAKTEELKPGASQLVEVTFSVKELASFDYNDVNENENAGYELEEGEYILSIRADSHTVLDSTTLNCEQLLTWDEDGNPDTPNNIFSQEDGEWEQYNTLAYHWTESGEDHYLTRDMLVVDGEVYDLEQLAWLLDEDENEFTHEAFNVLKGRKASHAYEDYDNVLTDEIETDYENVWTKEMSDIPAEWTQGTGVIDPATGRYAIELYDLLGVDYDDAKWDELLNQLTLDEMISLVLDGGYHTQSVESIGKPYVEDKDGPAQIGMGGGDSSGWAWCGAPLIAQTWNVELSYEVGEAIGNETMLLGGVGWYGPGMQSSGRPKLRVLQPGCSSGRSHWRRSCEGRCGYGRSRFREAHVRQRAGDEPAGRCHVHD